VVSNTIKKTKLQKIRSFIMLQQHALFSIFRLLNIAMF